MSERPRTEREPLLTPDQVAAELRVSKDVVYGLCHTRKLPAFRIGRQWRITRGGLDRYIAELEAEARFEPDVTRFTRPGTR